MAGRDRHGSAPGEISDGSLESRRLARDLQELATAGTPRFDFLRDVSMRIADFAGCSLVGLALRGSRRWYVGRLGEGWRLTTVGETLPMEALDRVLEVSGIWQAEERECWSRLLRGAGTRFWHGREAVGCDGPEGLHAEAAAIASADQVQGLLMLAWPGQDVTFRGQGVSLTAARPLAAALVYHRAQAALRERVKELTGLYELSKLTERTDREPAEVLARMVELLPPAWQYPEITVGRIEFDGSSWETGDPGEVLAWQEAPILVQGMERGRLQVGYTGERPELDEGPFMREERNLIDALAREVGLFLERWQTRHDRELLEEQLRHADRLATIGQLAAGVAHELNEPLAGILGFAQLSLEVAGLPTDVRSDLERIVKASLHAREIIKKLMLFSRQTPPRTEDVDVNQLVCDGLYVIESRCAKQGIEMRRELDDDIPRLRVDPGQIQQVLVNLVVNAVQAMPDGGKLFIRTFRREDGVCLEVEDTGPGIERAIRDRIFLPFFTTKDVDQGTGLGLAVVHGIVTAHHGSIEVDSEVGRGSRFRVWLPLPGRESGGEDAELA